MKPEIKQFLVEQALLIPDTFFTEIKGFQQTVVDGNNQYNQSGKLKKATVQNFEYKKGAKPINRFRIVKKAYEKVGKEKVIETVAHYINLSKKHES